jgi:hypothetical protein
MAEYFRDQTGKDVLLFIDNIFRFVQAGSEVSALLGRMPSAVGYQPTLATEMGELQERITSTKKGSVTSMQAIYVPADDYTDPAPVNDLRAPGRDDQPRALDRRARHLPGRRPAEVDVAHAHPTSSAKEHYKVVARACSRCCSATRTCRTSSRSSASTSSRRRQADRPRARARSSASSRSRSSSPSSSPARRASLRQARGHRAAPTRTSTSRAPRRRCIARWRDSRPSPRCDLVAEPMRPRAGPSSARGR